MHIVIISLIITIASKYFHVFERKNSQPSQFYIFFIFQFFQNLFWKRESMRKREIGIA